MIFDDNRTFFDALEKTGDAVRIKEEVDWDLEVGAITRRVCELGAPAPLFENIKDYPGFRMAGAPLATERRLAVALGLSPDAHYRELQDVYMDRLTKPVKPMLVDKAPCQENVLVGKDADIFKVPVPMIHEGDGGRYLGTWHAFVTRDPETDWINWGMIRNMTHGPTSFAVLMMAGGDSGAIYRKYVQRGENMPCAIVVGPDPLCTLAALATVGYQVAEADIAGGLRQKPVALVKCKTIDMFVPAEAEIVIEGELLIGEQALEGPFGEYSGFRTGPRMPRHVGRVRAVTHRNNAIFMLSNMGQPVDDSHITSSVTWGAYFRKALEAEGLPIKGVYSVPEATGVHMIIVSVDNIYANIAQTVANRIFSTRIGSMWVHQVVVVDSDVDPYNIKEVLHALATRCHPVHGIKVQDKAPGAPLLPFLSFEERKWNRGAKVLFDCMFPIDWDIKTERPFKVSFNNIYPQEVQEKVLSKWEKYGYK